MNKNVKLPKIKLKQKIKSDTFYGWAIVVGWDVLGSGI